MNTLNNLPLQSPVAIRTGAIGDMVMFLPVLEVLALKHNVSQIDVITSGGGALRILEHSKVLGNVLNLSGSRSLPIWLSSSKRQAKQWLKEHSDSSIYSLDRKLKLVDVISAAKIPLTQINLLTNLARDPMHHQIDEAIDFVDPTLTKDSPLRIPRLMPSKLPIDETVNWLNTLDITPQKPFVLMQAGNRKASGFGQVSRSSNIKYWPAEKWAAVINAITAQQPEIKILLCGSPGEKEFNDTIVSSCQKPDQVINVADDLPLDRLMALSTLAHSMISVDTGPAHIAAALDCPLTVLFGKTSPYRHTPRSKTKVVVVTEHNHAQELSKVRWDSNCSMEGVEACDVIKAWNTLHEN